MATPQSPAIQFCTSDKHRIAYTRSGNGPVLVKTSSYLSHIEYDWDSPIWRPWLLEWSEHFTLIRYDQRGCGLSDWDAADISFDGWVRDLEAVVDACGLNRFAILGLSQGASVAIAYAVRHPERVSHLVLNGAFVRGRLKRDQSPEQLERARTMWKLAELGWGQDSSAFREVFTMQFFPGGTLEQHESFNELQRRCSSPKNASRIMREFDSLDVTSLAPQVRCPTLVMHSRSETRIPFEEGRLVATLIPGARFLPIESRNHLPLRDEPAFAQINTALREFLSTETPSPSTRELATWRGQLTPRQRELVELIARGLSNAEIASGLGVSEKTVRNHITAIFAKLEVTSRAQAIVRAREAGFGGN
jgi:pimeloyl-ACP methyl ester carboxylesterase/DNA-binding CsgD family transcriptional regulator